MHSSGKNPRIVAWEITRRCELKCRHCRGAARDCDYDGEFSTEECFKTIDALADFSKPMIILTGGEPLMRDDIFEVARYATDKGCRVVLATCGHLLTTEVAEKLKASGVMAVSVSLDAATAEKHDMFRGIPDAYKKTVASLDHLKAAGLPFQINTTVSKLNVDELPKILDKAIELGAVTMDFFFLVPTGRGAEMADLALDPETREQALEWIAQRSTEVPIRVKTTCAPQYRKYISDPSFCGCMGGRGFVFISHTGVLQTCGFLDLPCGELRSGNFDFETLYKNSEVFKSMRTLNPFAGCPARAYARTGNFMEAE
ncbi:radical SAM protein [Tichowtungia aerotolerans]|uniref:Radical SAM protein n=1 Tax=Tichowtungia aerotolerans TaxID=2697043 RepID=A0A6P1M6H4_9BACT|nr:radical SAM protein [Tichowtungia aerotolerans]QHI68603.1 radical SAM protein [Tichowtungia aerotolerans]